MHFDEHENYLLKKWVVSQESARVGKKTTVTCLLTDNGYEAVGISTCTYPEDYDYEEGVIVATKDALRKIREIDNYVKESKNAWF